MKIKSDYVAELDGLKGLAILLIVVGACFYFPYSYELIQSASTGKDYWLQGLLGAGWIGRELFMVIAGFLTTNLFLKNASLTGFYERRARRLLPAYILVLLLSLKDLPINVPGVLSLWTFTSNWVAAIHGPTALPGDLEHLWLIALTVQFYLLWPLVVKLAGKHMHWVCLVLIIASPIARGLMIDHDPSWKSVILYVTPFHLDLFAWGALVSSTGDQVVGSRWMLPIWILSTLGLGGFFIYEPGFNWSDPNVADHGLRLLGLFFASSLTFLLPVRANQTRSNPLTFLFGFPLLQWFGRYSYGLYLFHQPVLLFLMPMAYLPAPGWSPLILFSSLVLGLSFLLALLSFHLLERRFLK